MDQVVNRRPYEPERWLDEDQAWELLPVAAVIVVGSYVAPVCLIVVLGRHGGTVRRAPRGPIEDRAGSRTHRAACCPDDSDGELQSVAGGGIGTAA